MKITGYTIIYFLLSILLLWGFIELEIWSYKTMWLTEKRKDDFIITNIIFLLIIIFTLWIFGYLDKLDKLLKKRIL